MFEKLTSHKKMAALLLAGSVLISFNAAAKSPDPFSITSPAGYMNPYGPNYLYANKSSATLQQETADEIAWHQKIFEKYASPAFKAKDVSMKLGSYVSESGLAECRLKVGQTKFAGSLSEKGQKVAECLKSTTQIDYAGGTMVLVGSLAFTGAVFGYASLAANRKEKKIPASYRNMKLT